MNDLAKCLCLAGLLAVVLTNPGLVPAGSAEAPQNALALYVAPDGNDAWSGRLATPNADQSDGPLASLDGARLSILYADPMFDEEAMQQKIFRFKSGSPAIKLGIHPIDLSTVGSILLR